MKLRLKVQELWRYWDKIRDRSNWALFFVSGLALTRGVLYTIPTDESIPRGLDLMPRGWLSLYGLLWLWAALYGFYQSTMQSHERRARWFLAAMFMAWASAYFAASWFPDDNRYSLLVTSIFFAGLGAVAFACRTRVVIKYQPIFIVHGADNEAGFEMFEAHDLDNDVAEDGHAS